MNQNRQHLHRRQRPHRKRAQRQDLVELWRGSGQSVDVFCAANDISPDTFTRWLAEFPNANSDIESAATHPTDPCSPPNPFVELRLDVTGSEDGPGRRQADLVVRGPGGVEIELYGPSAQLVVDHVVEMLKGGAQC